jgi:hypothetical protein
MNRNPYSFWGRTKRYLVRLALFLFGYVVLFAFADGVDLLTGKLHPEEGPVSRYLGAGIILVSAAILTSTVRHWARWVCAVAALLAVKVIFALLFGYTVSQPRLVTNRVLASEYLLLLMGIVVLSYRFAVRPPHGKLEELTLVGAPIGYAATMVTEPNPWPLLAAVVLLFASWLAGRLSGSKLRGWRRH